MVTQEQTAKEVWDYLTSRGWSRESVAAVLGNMQSESGIIADRWEGDRVGNMSGGYGLVQWTPATKYINWAQSNGLVYQTVSSQCQRLIWEVANNQQFYHPSMTFKQFTQSTQTPEVLADIFIRYYERPANPNQPARQTQARYWYNKFKDTSIGSNKGEFMMWALYQANANSPVRFFNGIHAYACGHPDEIQAIKQVYKANTGKDIPEMANWNDKSPFYNPLGDVLKRTPDF